MIHPMGKFIIAIILITACVLAFGQDKPKLEGGNVIAKGMCNFPPNAGYCFVVDKFSSRWIAVHDEKGQKAIYLVKPSASDKEQILPEDVQLVWSRDSV